MGEWVSEWVSEWEKSSGGGRGGFISLIRSAKDPQNYLICRVVAFVADGSVSYFNASNISLFLLLRRVFLWCRLINSSKACGGVAH